MNEQIDVLADFIMAEVEGEPSQSEGAGDCAIRIIRSLMAELEQAEDGRGALLEWIKEAHGGQYPNDLPVSLKDK